MTKSRSLRVQDMRAIFLLVGECRELGDDAVIWRRHLVRRAAELVGAGVGDAAEWIPAKAPAGRHEMVGLVDWGWENGFDKRAYDELLAAFSVSGPGLNPMFGPYFAAIARDNGVCMSRADLVADKEWYRSRYYQDYHRATGANHILYGHRFSHDRANRYQELTLARHRGARDFNLRHRAVIRELQATLVPLVGGPLATLSDPRQASCRHASGTSSLCCLAATATRKSQAGLASDATRLTITPSGFLSTSACAAVANSWPDGYGEVGRGDSAGKPSPACDGLLAGRGRDTGHACVCKTPRAQCNAFTDGKLGTVHATRCEQLGNWRQFTLPAASSELVSKFVPRHGGGGMTYMGTSWIPCGNPGFPSGGPGLWRPWLTQLPGCRIITVSSGSRRIPQ